MTPKKFVQKAKHIELEELPEAHARPWRGSAWLLGVGLLLLGASTVIAWSRMMPGWEQHIFSVINGANLPRWVAEEGAKPISNAVWGIMGLTVVCLLFAKLRRRAWQYAVAAGSAYILVVIIEHVVRRARPQGLIHDVVLRATQDGPGFPSGHVAVLVAVCLMVWGFVSWPWRILLVLFVVAEGWSRIYLGVHAPLDIVGAVGAGLIVVAVMRLAPERLRKLFWLP